MLCSIDSTAAAAATTTTSSKSGSTWLDRLRISKGFQSTAEDDDLDHFLAGGDGENQNHKTTIVKERNEKGKEWMIDDRTISNVLSELFNMGGGAESSSSSSMRRRKKSVRKQSNPKFCCIVNVSDKNSSGDDNAQQASLNSDSNCKTLKYKLVGRNGTDSENDGVELEDEEKGKDKELFGFSKSEVTVIDTSFAVWKFDKLLFRKKNVWKVGDKKGGSKLSHKSAILARKRKFAANANANANATASDERNVDDYVVSNKRAKVSPPEFDSLNAQDSKRGQLCEVAPDDLSRVTIKRKSKKGASSTILGRGIHTTKNRADSLPKIGLKGSEQKSKASLPSF